MICQTKCKIWSWKLYDMTRGKFEQVLQFCSQNAKQRQQISLGNSFKHSIKNDVSELTKLRITYRLQSRTCSYGIAWQDIPSSEEKYVPVSVTSPSEMKSARSKLAPKTPHFISATGLACSYGELSSRPRRISLLKDDISVSELARLLIWTRF